MEYDNKTKTSVLIATSIASFLTPFMGSALNISLLTIGKEFNLKALDLNWIITAYMLSIAAFLMPMGHLADVVSRKKIFVWGLFLSSIMALLSGFAYDGVSLITIRAIHGLTSAMTFSSAVALLISVYPPQTRGKILGINVSFVYIGLTLGPIIGGFITEQLNWRFIFYIVALLGFISCLMIKIKLNKIEEEPIKRKFDFSGSLFYTTSIGLGLYSISTINTSIYSKYTLIISVLLLGFFIRLMLKSKNALLNLYLFKNISFAYSNMAALIHYSAISAITFLLALYLQVIKGLSPQKAGFILLIQPLLMAVLSPQAGKLSDKMEPRLLASLGMAFTFIGILCLIFVTQDTSLTMIVLILVIIGIGFGFFSSPNTNAVMSSVEKAFYGTASSTLGTMRILGQTTSMALVTFFFSIYLANVPIVSATHELILASMKISFITFAVLCFLGIFISIIRGKVHSANNS